MCQQRARPRGGAGGSSCTGQAVLLSCGEGRAGWVGSAAWQLRCPRAAIPWTLGTEGAWGSLEWWLRGGGRETPSTASLAASAHL